MQRRRDTALVRLPALCAAACLALAPVHASASVWSIGMEPPPQEAIDAFMRGKQLYDEGRYDEALSSFMQANNIHSAPDLYYNIGLCYQRLRRWRDAIDAFETYLRGKPDASDRPDVEDRLVMARTHLRDEEGDGDPIDGDSGDDGGGQIDPGDDGPGKPQGEKNGRGLIIAGATLLGIGAAASIGFGVGFGLRVQSKNDELDEVLEGGNPNGLGFGAADDLESDAKRLRNLQIGLTAGSAAVGVVGLVLLLVGVKRRRSAKATAAVRPMMSPTAFGLSATWKL